MSFATVAVKVTEFVASTVVADAVTATLTGFEPPPHPDRLRATRIARPVLKTKFFLNTGASPYKPLLM